MEVWRGVVKKCDLVAFLISAPIPSSINNNQEHCHLLRAEHCHMTICLLTNLLKSLM